MKNRAETILRRLISIDTSNPAGNEMDIVKEIINMFPKDTKYEIINHGDNRGSLMIEVCGKSKESIGFIGHIDTVPVNDSADWSYPPFEAYIKDGYVYGRGSADMKGGVTAMILTALHFVENNITSPNTLKFCFTADEESDGIGITSIMSKGILKDVTKVFIPEPSGEAIGICEKGALWLEVSVDGKSSHASRPDLGINAIDKLYEFVNRFKDSIDFVEHHPLLGYNTCSITQLNAGVKVNVIPNNAIATLDIRTIPSSDHTKIIENAKKIGTSMTMDNLDIEIKVLNNRPSISVDEDNEFIKEISEIFNKLSYTIEYKGLNFYTDASQIVPLHPIPFVILGPGDEKMAHQKNERIEIESIVRMVNVYTNYILG